MNLALDAIPYLITLLPFVIAAALFRWAGILRYIPNNRIGIVEQLWSRRGSVARGLIALDGEAGYRADVLRGGFHWFWPFQCRVHKRDLVTIGQGRVGYIFARDGQALDPDQTLARNLSPATGNFEDAAAFLRGGGQKGPQSKLLREGTYAINTAQFVVMAEDSIYSLSLSQDESDMIGHMHDSIAERDGFHPVRIVDGQDKIGIVTVHDGPAMLSGEIIAPDIGAAHNNFQDPAAFIAGGGKRGRQLQVLVEGTYWINRLFATVEFIDKTVIDIGFAGVVVSFTGPVGTNTKNGLDYKHGELVETGFRGVWRDPLLPGKYPFNTYAGRLVAVPTTNFVLKWDMSAEFSAHRLDDNLSEIALVTRDAFEPVMPLSVVVHIDYRRAPEVVQRFGDVKRLVEQTLDPMVSAFFKDIGQRKTLIELIQERADIQEQALDKMSTRFGEYSLELLEVLIGTPRAQPDDKAIETILDQLRERQVAREKVETYALQSVAADKEREFNESKARAAAQTQLTQSGIAVTVAQNNGAAALAQAQKDAERIQVLAQAAATKERLEGEGKAAAIAAIGQAEALATKAQVDAYGGPEFRLSEAIASKLFEAIADGHQPVVPHILVGASGTEGGAGTPAGLVSGLVAALLPKVETAASPASLPVSVVRRYVNGDARP